MTSITYNLMHRLRQQGYSALARFQIWRTRRTLPPAGLGLSISPPPRRFLRERQEQNLSATNTDWLAEPIPARQTPRDPLSKNGEAPHPFLPFLHPVTKRWHPPAISPRREAKLVNEAFKTGQLDLIPDDSPKKIRLLARLSRGREITGWTEDWKKSATTKQSTAAAATAPTAVGASDAPSQQAATTTTTISTDWSSSSSSSSSPLSLSSSSTTTTTTPASPTAFTPEEVRSHQTSIFRYLAEAGYGPMKGRNPKVKGMKRFFKGTKGQRTRKAKDAAILTKLDAMEQSVAQYRTTKRAQASSKVPNQPF